MFKQRKKSGTKVYCCSSINADARIRIISLLIMTKLLGRVSGFSPLPCPGTPATSPQRRLPLPWWAFDRPQHSPLNAVPGQTWSGWDAGSFLAHTMHYAPPTPDSPSRSLSLSLPVFLCPPFPSRASGLLCKAFQAEMWEFFSSTFVPKSNV